MGPRRHSSQVTVSPSKGPCRRSSQAANSSRHGSASRSLPAADLPGLNSTGAAAALYAVHFRDLVDLPSRVGKDGTQAGRGDSSSPADPSATMDGCAVAFWRTTVRAGTKPGQLPQPPFSQPLAGRPLDFFVSHTWQPGPDTSDMAAHAHEKVHALHRFGQIRSALGGGNDTEGPTQSLRFLNGPVAEGCEDNGICVPEDISWLIQLCWVDKACSQAAVPGGVAPSDAAAPTSSTTNLPGTGGACTAAPAGPAAVGSSFAEAMRLTKLAISSCQSFIAVLTSAYFTRLWCTFEWTAFAVQVAPHYRCLELAVPESLLAPDCWRAFLDTLAAFSLASLRASSDGDRLELRRELEKAAVSTEGFERWVQATALALLARFVLLSCSKQCVAFASRQGEVPEALEALAVTCDRLGLFGLATSIRSATPKVWWQVAHHHAKSQEAARQHQQDDEALRDMQDPLRRLAKIINETFRVGGEAGESPDTGGTGPELPGSMEAGAYAMQALERGDDPEKTAALAKVCHWAKATGGESGISKLQHPKGQGSGPAGAAQEGATEASPQASSDRAPSPSQAQRHPGQLNSFLPAWNSLPDGFAPFWHGARGRPISMEDCARARIFHAAWAAYRRRVNRWFDASATPHLELWRQRGLRSRGALEDTFRTLLQDVAGPLQDALSERLACLAPQGRPRWGADGLAPLERQLPSLRGRPELAASLPWNNPTMDRLLVANLPSNAGGGDMVSPALIASPLPLRLVEYKAHTLLCLRVGQDWRRLQISHRLGAPAFATAVRHLMGGAPLGAEVEIEIIAPRLALEVSGSLGVRAVLGSRIAGLLREAATAEAESDAKLHRSLSTSSTGESAADSPTIADSGGQRDLDAEDEVDWLMWFSCRPNSKSINDSVPVDKNSGEPSSAAVQEQARGRGARGAGRCPPVPPHVAMAQRPAVPRSAHADLGPTADSKPLWLNPHIEVNSRRNPGPGGLLPGRAVLAETMLPSIQRPAPSSQVPEQLWASGRAAAGVGTKRVLALGIPPGSARHPRTALERRGQTEEKLPQVPLSARQAAGRQPPRVLAAALAGAPTPPAAPAAGEPAESERLMQLRWEWGLRVEGGGPLEHSGSQTAAGIFGIGHPWVGVLPELLSRAMGWLNSANLSHWVPVESAAATHGHTLVAARAGKPARKPVGPPPPPPLKRGDLPCSRCGHTDTAALSLEESMLREIWKVPACKVCVACGHIEPMEAVNMPGVHATALDGDDVLEVATTAPMRFRSSSASEVQRLAARVLRVEPGQVSVAAACKATSETAPTQARQRIAHITISSRGAGVAAAAAMARLRRREGGWAWGVRPFTRDVEWVHTCLRDTGLDLIYDENRPVSVDIAIEEIDDHRMLPRRREVQPLLLWAELRHVLGADFNLTDWIHACFRVIGWGRFSLPAALSIKRNVERLRSVTGVCRGSRGDELPIWPLALHRVLLAREGAAEEVLGRMLASAGIPSDGAKALRKEGAAVLKRMHEEGTWAGQAPSQEPGAPSDGPCVDAARIMRELAHRRLNVNTCVEVNFRAMLRARRLLRQIQVSNYLDGLVGAITQSDDRRRRSRCSTSDYAVGSNEDQASGEKSSEEDEDEEDGVDKFRWELNKNTEELTLQKVLGHAKEYVHQKDVLLKALKVLNVIVQTFSRFAAIMGRSAARADRTQPRIPCTALMPHLEQILVDQGFTRTALRAIYRHYHRPEICGCALSLLAHLIADAAHGCRHRVAVALSHPPERFLTLAVAAGKISQAGDLQPLITCLRVLNTVAYHGGTRPGAQFRAEATGGGESEAPEADAPSMPPSMPSGREHEAAEAFFGIFERHSEDQDIFISMLELLGCLVRDAAMCKSFVRHKLTVSLRGWLLRSAAGQVQDAWNKVARQRSEHVLVGLAGRGARALKEVTSLLNGVRKNVMRGERLAWGLLCSLAQGAEGCETFLEDTMKTVRQGIGELHRNGHGTQWAHAIDCLTKLVAFERDTGAQGAFRGRPFSAAILDGDGLRLLSAEFPDGEVETALLLLREVVDASGRPPSVTCDLNDPGEDQGEDESVKARAPATAASTGGRRRSSASEGEEEGAELPTQRARRWLVQNNAANWLMEALRKHSSENVQCGLCRVLGALLQAPYAKKAVQTFRAAGAQDGTTLQEVVQITHQSAHSEDVVGAALHMLQSAIMADGLLAVVLSDLGSGCSCLMDIVWKHLGSRDLRKRALALLMQVHEVMPGRTAIMAALWAQRRKLHTGRGCRDDMEEPALEEDGLNTEHLDHPYDVRRFGAWLSVHCFVRSAGEGPVAGVIAALAEFKEDEEICLLGLQGLLVGEAKDVMARVRAILEVPGFHKSMRSIVMNLPRVPLLLCAMRLLTCVLAAEPRNLVDYVELATITVSSLLESAPKWCESKWEALLVAADMIGCSSPGRTELIRFEILVRIEEEWQKLVSKDDTASKAILWKYKSDTMRTLGKEV